MSDDPRADGEEPTDASSHLDSAPETHAEAAETQPVGSDPHQPRRAAAGKPGTGRRTNQLLLAVLVGLLVVLLGAGVGIYFNAKHALSKIPRSGLLPTATDRPPPPDGPMSFLILGADSRDYDPSDPGRSDTMMIGWIPKDRKHIYLISITRDLWVPIHGGAYAKINAAYADGGAPLTVQTVEDLLGVGLNHVALMDFDGFMQMTNTLGGVQVWNEDAFTDSADMGCNFPEGWVTVQGDCGLAYVRERHNSPDGDLGRAARQRNVAKAIIGKAVSAGVITNPAKANALLAQLSNTFTLDDQVKDDDLLALAATLKISSASDVRSLQLPVGGYDRSLDGQDINVPDREQLAELAQALRTDTMDNWWATHDPSLTYTDNPEWAPGTAPWGTPSPRPRVPLPTATPGPTSASPTSKKSG